MGVIKFDRDFSTLFNWDTDDNPTTEQDYQNAVKNWTETEMNLVDALLWQPTTAYIEGNMVKTPSLPSQYMLKCTESGTSGSTEPSYSGASVGDTVTDGTAEWVIVSLATGAVADADASNIGVNAEIDNSEEWGSAIGGGAVAEDDGRLVKGSTVHAVTSVMETNIATNTEAIEDNTEAIATNTANIEASAVKIDIDDKRISNIEKLLQGQLYDYQTDSTSAYTKTVPSGAMPYASLDKLGGKTVVWNQLVQNGNFADGTTGWTGGTGSVLSISDGALLISSQGTTNRTYYTETSVNIVANHRYLVLGTFEKFFAGDDADAKTHRISAAGSGTAESLFTISTPTVGVYDIAGIGVPTIDNTIIRITTIGSISPSQASRPLFSLKNIRVSDLTFMFGSGNEPSTVQEFQQMFPAVWYAFNEGTLLSAGVTEVVSKKADTTTIATYPIPAPIQALEGYGWSCPSHYNYIDFEAKKFVQEVGSRAYASGDESDSTVITDMTTTYYPLNPAVETDISAYLTDDNLIEVEAGGTLTFPNANGDDYRIPVPSAETYMIDLQASL